MAEEKSRRRTPRKGNDGSGKNQNPRRRPIKNKQTRTPKQSHNCQTPEGLSINNNFGFSDTEFNLRKRRFAGIMCSLPQDSSSKYAAFLLAGFTGCKEDCDQFVRRENMTEMVANALNRKMMIDETQGHTNSKLKEKTVQAIEHAIGKGMTIGNAVYLGGIDSNTYRVWYDKGREDIISGKVDTNHAKFVYRIDRAKPRGELVLLDTIHDAALGRSLSEDKVETVNGIGVPTRKEIRITKRHWQAAAWILERTRRETYGRDAKPQIDDGKTASEEAQAIVDAMQLLINNQIPDLESVDSDEDDNGSN